MVKRRSNELLHSGQLDVCHWCVCAGVSVLMCVCAGESELVCVSWFECAHVYACVSLYMCVCVGSCACNISCVYIQILVEKHPNVYRFNTYFAAKLLK